VNKKRSVAASKLSNLTFGSPECQREQLAFGARFDEFATRFFEFAAVIISTVIVSMIGFNDRWASHACDKIDPEIFSLLVFQQS
jgi:hypothetical protein